MQSLSFRTVHTGFFLFLENISNPCNSEERLIRIQNEATKTGCTPRQ